MRRPFNKKKYELLLEDLAELKSVAANSPLILFAMPQLSHNYIKFGLSLITGITGLLLGKLRSNM